MITMVIQWIAMRMEIEKMIAYTRIKTEKELTTLVSNLLEHTTINKLSDGRKLIINKTVSFREPGFLFLLDGTVCCYVPFYKNYRDRLLTIEQFYEKAVQLFPKKKEKNNREKTEHKCNKCQFYFHEKERHYIEGELKVVGEELCLADPKIIDISNRNKEPCSKFKKKMRSE